jgi:hypothetical protein
MLPRRLLVFQLALIFCSATLLVPAKAFAAPLETCRISASPRESVSLGFPIKPERLIHKKTARILIVPFRLSDRPDYVFTSEERSSYLAAGTEIEKLSGGKSKLEFVFNDVIDVSTTTQDIVTLKSNQQLAWQKDESISTWGFVRNFVSTQDSKINFTNIDGLILHGSATRVAADTFIAEAFMFTNADSGWFRKVPTAEGNLLNAVLIEKPSTASTPLIVHEILHLYGLQDLYGTNNGPKSLSIMDEAMFGRGLLAYEKWVLGWVSDEVVQCIDEAVDIDQSKVSTQIQLDLTKNEQIVVIKRGAGTAFVIEFSKSSNQILSFYSLDNDLRPPINVYSVRARPPAPEPLRAEGKYISSQLDGTKYVLLISDLVESKLILNLIPTPQLPNASDLIQKSEQARQAFMATQQAPVTTPTTTPVTKPAIQKKTIVCVKGKMSKKVIAVKPVCPKGFTKKK